MYDIVVAGAGAAGLTAAIYARRASRSVLVLEEKSCGGQILNTPDIENYPALTHVSGFDFASHLTRQAKGLGVEIRMEKVVELRVDGAKKTVITEKSSYPCRAIVLATGSKNRKLGLENEDALLGRGLSYCATCDGNFFRGKDVAVVGGGNTALEDALYLSGLAANVYLIHRRDSFRGVASTVERLKQKPNVQFIYNSTVTKLNGEKRLEGVEVTNKDGSVQTIPVRGLFVAIGRIPANRCYDKLIRLDEAGYAIAGENCRTDVPGVFVAGDNRTKEVRQLVTAAADGAVAATEAIKYLESL